MVRAPMTTPVPQVTAFAPVHELIRKLRDGELAALQLTNLYLERIDRFDSKLNAYVSVLADHARAAAQSADRDAEAGRWRGPLHGIPFGVKDIIEYDGHQTTWGSMALEGRMSDHSAAVVTKLEAAGAIVIGKTQTVEFALGGWGTNQHRGTPWNPWDLETHRIPGGSSSGSGVASAAGLAAFTLGTDTGGSVRLPSAFCGLVGLKPTFGRVSNHGVMPLSTTLDSVGPLARCVEDAALIYNLMQGADSNDPVTTLHASVDPLPTLRNGIDGMRLAIMPKAERTHATAPVLAAYDESLRVLQSLGAVLVNIELPCSFGDFRNAVSAVASAEGYATTCELMDQEHLPLDQHVRRRMLAGRDVSAKDYLHGMREMTAWRSTFRKLMKGFDALLTPTGFTTAIPVSEVDEMVIPAYYTRATNILELCALALPNGYGPDGLPISLCIHGHPFAEATVLRIGWALEQATIEEKRQPRGLI